MSTAEDYGVETVPNTLCNEAEVPETVQKCSLYCPSECAVSDWGQWSPCPQVGSPARVPGSVPHVAVFTCPSTISWPSYFLGK